MVSRRAFLGTTAAAALGVVTLGRGVRLPEATAATIRPAASGLALTISNKTGKYGNGAITAYVLGIDPSTNKQGHVGADGTFTPCSLSDNGSDGYTNYGIALNGSGDTTIGLPKMSGRIYFAINDKLKIKVVTDGNGNPAMQYPAGWVENDPNYNIMHDWIEFTLNDSGMHCNTTMVDMFSVPLSITLNGTKNQTTGTLVDGGRDQIFSAIAGQSDFSKLVVGDKLRVIAPSHGIDAGVFSAGYYDSYIDAVWSKYEGTGLTVKTDSATYTGKVSGGSMTFTGGSKTPAPIAKPSTADVLNCNGALAAPNDGVTGPVAAILGAGFNRSTLLDSTTQPTTDPSAFYKNATTNHYAAAMHAATKDGKAYGFPFDDVASFASYIEDGSPSSMTITLTPF